MEIELLREFITLCNKGNYTDAAEALFLSPSSLSKHIVKLEKELGIALFERTTRSVHITEAGRQFLPHAQKMIERYDMAIFDLRRLAPQSEYQISVAFLNIMGQYGLMEVLTDFQKLHPEIIMNMDEISGLAVMSSVMTGKIDFCFTDHEYSEDLFQSDIYVTDYLVAMLPVTHPLATKTTITLRELENEPIIMHASHRTQTMLQQSCEAQQVRLQMKASVSFASAAASLVRQGVGVSILSYIRAAQIKTDGLKFVRIVPDISFHISMISRKNYHKCYATECFREYILEAAKRLHSNTCS